MSKEEKKLNVYAPQTDAERKVADKALEHYEKTRHETDTDKA